MLLDFWTRIHLQLSLCWCSWTFLIYEVQVAFNSWPSPYLSNKIIKMNHIVSDLESMQLPPSQGRIQHMRFREVDRLFLGRKRNSGHQHLLSDAAMSLSGHRAQYFGSLRTEYFLPILIGRK